MNDLDPAVIQKLLAQWQSGNQTQSVSDGQYGIQPIYGWQGGDGGTQTIAPGVFAQAPDSADGKRQIDQWDPYTGKYIGRGTDTTSWTTKDWLMAIGGLTGAAALGGAFAGAGAAGGTGAATVAGSAAPSATGLAGAGSAAALTPAELEALGAISQGGAFGIDGVTGMTAAGDGLGSIGSVGATGVTGGTAGGLSGGGVPYTSAAADSQAANAALGLGPNSGSTPGAVNLSNAGGTMATGASGWDALGRAATSDAGLKAIGTIGGALASGAAANSLAPNPDSSKLDQLLSTYLTEMGKTSARADDQWNNYLSTWRPIENKFAQSVLNYDTPARREQAAQEAGGSVASQFDLARSAGLRDAMAAGVDPSTIAALGAASRIDEAKATAGAKNNARTAVENTGLSLLQAGSNFGRNLPQTSLNASSVATVQGNAAGNTSVAANKMETDATTSRNQLFGDLFGAGLKAYGMFSSSKKTKRMGGKVDGLSAARAVEKSPAQRWNYKPGMGDGNAKDRMGPTAESLSKVAPEVSDGKKVDGIAMLGLHHAAIGNNSQRLRRIEKRLGLSDARKD